LKKPQNTTASTSRKRHGTTSAFILKRNRKEAAAKGVATRKRREPG
jgi:hypothetical protein